MSGSIGLQHLHMDTRIEVFHKTGPMDDVDRKLVFMFVDNSNIFIGAKYSVAALEQAGEWDQKKTTRHLSNCRVDYGFLMSHILGGRQLGAPPLLVGSRPPLNDTIWETIKGQGFDVTIFDRNTANKEKRVDTTIAVQATACVCKQKPAVLVIVAGDGDYDPVVTVATDHGWSIEIYSWKTGRVESELCRSHVSCSSLILPRFVCTGLNSSMQQHAPYFLDDCYKVFTYAVGAENLRRPYYVEVAHDDLDKYDNEAIMKIVHTDTPDEFAWWVWQNSTTLSVYTKTEKEQARLADVFGQHCGEWVVDKWSM